MRILLAFAAVLLFSAGCDQATKRIAVDQLAASPPISLAGDLVRFELAANHGGFLSLGAGLPEGARRLVFVALVPILLLVLCALALRSRPVSAWMAAGLGLVAGGGLGNWLDRVRHDGAVTDFVSLGAGGMRTGIFNVADVAVIAGVLLLAFARSDDGAAQSEERVMTGPSRGLGLAALSGVLSFAACYVPDWGTQWGAGLVFGLLVLGPTQRSAGRFLALVTLSVVVYRAAVWTAVRLTVDTPVPAVAACALAGMLGAAALTLGAAAVTGAVAERGAAVRAALWGAVAGAAIGVAGNAPADSLARSAPLLAGFVLWQVGYTAAHRLAPWRGAAAGADGPLRTPA